MTDAVPEIHEATAQLSEVRLHYLEAGSGPLVVLLHGFPDFSAGWRRQIPMLAAAGFRVVAPDLRGYNLSSKPEGIDAYHLRRLANDVRELIAERGAESAMLAGHDWGANVAWATAAWHPEVVQRLAILNLPHPRRMAQGLRTRRQLRKSWYIIAFQIPWLPERVLAAGGYRILRQAVEADAPAGSWTASDTEAYVQAWRRPGAVAGMLGLYRSAARAGNPRLPPIPAPTLVIWGGRDRFLGAELAEPDRRDVPNLRPIAWLDDASHWVMRDEPERVGELLISFFAGDTELGGGS